MGKGKDKKKGKGIVSSMQSLSVSDTPTTSQASTTEETVAPEEEFSGLTGSSKRASKKKQKAASVSSTVTTASSPVTTASSPEQQETIGIGSEDKATSKEEQTPSQPSIASDASTSKASAVEAVPSVETAAEEEFSGLTGGGKKSGKKKQKATTETPTPSEASQPQKEEESGGLGLGGGRKRPPRSKKAKAAAEAASTGESASAPTAATPSVTSPVQASPFPPKPSGAGRGWGPTQPATLAQFPTQASSLQSPPPAEAQEAPKYTALPAVAQSQVPGSKPPQPRPSDTALCRFKIPKRIEGNTVPGHKITVLTNYLAMTVKPAKIHRYDVSFKPDRPKKLLPKAFLVSKNKAFGNHLIAFDQMKNCYTLTALKNVTSGERLVTNVELQDNNGKTLHFEVSYKFTGLVDLSTIHNYMSTGGTSLTPPTEAIQCIDVILRQGTLESYVKAGRQFFQRPAQPIDLGDGLEMWTGLFQSGIFTSRAFINIDVAHKGIPRQQPLLTALTNDFRLDVNKPLKFQRNFESFETFLKGLRVVAMIGGDSSKTGQRREFICNGTVGPASQEEFAFEDQATGKSRKMTVADYFRLVKKVKLRYPNLVCVWVGPREKTIYYPMELLEVSYGQAQNKQLNERQLATMVRQAATPPDERKRKIEEVIRNMNYSRNETFKKFGLTISDQFHPVTAKVLHPPNLEVGRGQVIQPRRGVWNANRVYKPEPLQSWGFIAIEVDGSRCNFQNIIDLFKNNGRQMGMDVSEPKMCNVSVKIQDLRNVLLDALVTEIRFLFVIVSSRGRDYYHKVKQMAERDVGILTQCIKEQTAIMKMNQQTARNILLKVNSKLMGINQVLEGRSLPRCLKSGGVMVVGADVTHPSPDQSNIPSIAAVTASIDPKCFLYNMELSIQTPKREMIVEFEDMMVDHLKVYYQRQQAFPKKIFVFRDGVSEGQFAQVLNSELQAVHNAYRRVCGPQAKVEVLFLLVQKRHHTRLFVPNSNQNVEPGTVVDTEIVHASELDFYLVSHYAIKGTARPTRYHAVCNDGGIKHDEVEELTYYLCHLYSRCMRAVSYPTPTYYAHLACFRARSLTHGERFDNKELEKQPKRLRVMDNILKHSRMFFV